MLIQFTWEHVGLHCAALLQRHLATRRACDSTLLAVAASGLGSFCAAAAAAAAAVAQGGEGENQGHWTS